MNIVLFDASNREALFPVSTTRPIAEIRVGMFTIVEKWEAIVNHKVSALVPSYLAKKFPAKMESQNTFVNGAVLPTKALFEEIQKLENNQKLVQGNTLVAFVSESVKWNNIEKLSANFDHIELKLELNSIGKTWDIVKNLKSELINDFDLLGDTFTKANVPEYTTAISAENIIVGANVKIGACILNASEGKIVIDDEAEIMDGAIVKGPVYIGKHSTIKMGAKLYGAVSIGPYCKVGGELIETIFQAYSNKGHDGFIGHSYLGEWCNLGANTNISNLKNTYEQVRLWNYTSGSFEKTGMQFLGLIMGDHSKTGINTMLNTGSVIGVACNIYGAGFPRNFIPDFTMGSSRKMELFPLKNVYKMAEVMMKRRNLEFDDIDKNVLLAIIENTKMLRK
ncbi:MAG: putative sugar nucleotidyl transferase [Prolixibacteraceae bacterium]|jgi:UDP-N-acetylglucosamine diphosphorylase/glucosamine-1-phosphate N-acetyltransferase|nr:putative sugar nucleotidyl transferase [Prolixibacteraceae bacterium]